MVVLLLLVLPDFSMIISSVVVSGAGDWPDRPGEAVTVMRDVNQRTRGKQS